ncbi:MAG: hypothetical protein ACK5FZ_01685 [Bacteroidota bacterium]|jgi:hypothetical protein
MMKKALYFCVIVVICASCAFLGSSSKLVNPPTKKISNVAVLIVQDVNEHLSTNTTERLIFTKAVAEELAFKKTFRFVILERQYDFTSFDRLLKSDLAKELETLYDAFLICHPVQKGFNYKVEMVLVQTGTGMEIVRAKHGTGMGNSYWWIESPTATLVDATKGAVHALTRKLQRHNNP